MRCGCGRPNSRGDATIEVILGGYTLRISLLNPFKRYSQKVGLPPGTLVYVGEERTEPVRITITDYDEKHLHEEEIQTVEACLGSVYILKVLTFGIGFRIL